MHVINGSKVGGIQLTGDPLWPRFRFGGRLVAERKAS